VILRAVLSEAVTPGRVSSGKLVSEEGAIQSNSKTLMEWHQKEDNTLLRSGYRAIHCSQALGELVAESWLLWLCRFDNW